MAAIDDLLIAQIDDLAIRRDTLRVTTPAQLDEVFARRAQAR